MSIEIGNVYSRLTVLSKAEDRISPTSGKARFYWVCKCSCDRNKIIEVRSDGLTGGRTKSCGCLRDEAAAITRKNSPPPKGRSLPSLLGNKYGLLEVVSLAEPAITPLGRKCPRWTCECSCGNSLEISHDQLRKGQHVSCGCVSKKGYELGFTTANQEFIYKAELVHQNTYDYSLVEYKHSQENIKIVCKNHGVFGQQASNHLMGGGCWDCWNDSRSHNLDSFIEKATIIHGTTYDYTLVEFKSSKDRVEIICKEHGVFTQKPNEHLSGRGCQACGQLRKFVGLDDFIKRSNEVHNNKFDYTNSVYEHSNSEIEIICRVHGSFFQKPSAHMMGHQCPKCSGEERALKQHWNYVKRCELNPEMAESIGYLYLLDMSVNEENFLKIGISTNYKKRLGRYREEGLDFTILKVIETTAVKSAILESQVLKFVRNQEVRYIPNHGFKGWTECADINSKELIIDYYEELNV